MARFIDLIGRRFGRLFVLYLHSHDNGSVWVCRCDCGKIIITKTSKLNSGEKKSCGCLLIETRNKFKNDIIIHGNYNHPLYQIYFDMKRRCYDKNKKDYKNYGGRGIAVCERWKSDFLNFVQDMGDRPKGYTLERINNNGNYEPLNCKWATRNDQNKNLRYSKIWNIKGFVFNSASDAGKYFNVCHATIINWCKSKQDCYSVLKYDNKT